MTLIGGLAIPGDCQPLILGDAFSLNIPEPEAVLGISVALVGGLAKPHGCPGVVLWDALAPSVPYAETVLRF